MRVTPLVNSHKRILTPSRNVDGDVLSKNNETNFVGINYRTVSMVSKLNPTFIQEMQNLKEVRCPICNTKMLNKEEFKQVLQDISQITTGADLQGFVTKYSECINPIFDPSLKTLKMIISENPSGEANNHLKRLQKTMLAESDLKINALMSTVSMMANDNVFPEESRLVLKNLEKRLSSLKQDASRVNYYRYISSLIKKSLTIFEARDKHKQFRNLIGIVEQPLFSENLLPQPEFEQVNHTEFFCRKLLGHSLSDIRKAFSEEEANTRNMLLSCSFCEAASKKFMFTVAKNKGVYYDYVYDMAKRALGGELSSSKDYPIKLMENVKKHFDRVSPDLFEPNVSALYEELGISPRKNVDFPLVDVSGVPCAYCGQKTITHKEKQGLYTSIANAQSKSEIFDIVQSRKDVIKPRYQPILSYYNRIKSNLENMDEEQVLVSLRRGAAKDITEGFWKAIADLNKVASEYKLAGEDRKDISAIIKKLDTYIRTFKPNGVEEFPLYEYKLAVIEHTKRFKDRKALNDAVWKAGYESFLDKYHLQKTLVPIESVAQKLGSALKAVAQTIFKHSVATIEHLDPKFKYSSPKSNPDLYKRYLGNRNANLVVACRECNVKKKTTDLRLWVAGSPSIISNFKSFLKYSRDIQKTQNLRYNVYEVATQFKKLTGRDITPL